MRQQLRFVALAAMLFAMASMGSASDIASTDFANGGDGTIAGDTSGTGWAADGWTVMDPAIGGGYFTGDMSYDVPGGGTVSASGGVQFIGPGGGAAVQRELASPFNGDDVYISFLTKWETGEITSNDFVVWYFNNNGGPNIGYKADQGPDGEDFVGRTRGNTNQYAPDQLVVGDTYFVVGHLSKSTPGAENPYDTYSLWVNPAYGDAGTPESTSSGESNISEFTNVGVRTHQINPGGEQADDLRFAALRIGTTWASVVPPVPEPTSVLTALIGLLSLAGLRRRR